MNGRGERFAVKHQEWPNQAKLQQLLITVLPVSLLLLVMIVAGRVSPASRQPLDGVGRSTQRHSGAGVQTHGVARAAGVAAVHGLLSMGMAARGLYEGVARHELLKGVRGGRRGLQEQLGRPGMADGHETNTGAMSNSSNMGSATGGISGFPAGASNITTSAGNDTSGGGDSSATAESSVSPPGNLTEAGYATAPSSSSSSSSITPARNNTAAGNLTRSGNFSGAAGNGTEGGAVRYFTVGQEAFVWGSPLVTFFRQQATRAALDAFSFANTTAVVGTTSELQSPFGALV
ncbi:unnamed protein product [Closterium sp. NIES-53]